MLSRNTKRSVRHLRPPSRLGAVACAFASILLLTAMSGCYTERVVNDSFSDLRGISDKPEAPADSLSDRFGRDFAPSAARIESSHAILLATFEGKTQQAEATRLMHRLQRELAVPDLWLRQTSDKTHLYRGVYMSDIGPGPEGDLRQTRLLQLDGTRPFEHVQVLKLTTAAPASTDEMNLKRYAGQGFYSLQVAVYDDDFGAGFREAAERAAKTLRDDGDAAFFYHGPHRSMVTVGLFTYDEAWVDRIGGAATYSAQVRDLQARYQFNLHNGRTVIEKSAGQRLGEQTSSLVQIR